MFIYYIFGYRKKTVRNNLELAFPNKTEKERLVLEKAFYHHLSDLFIEMIKAFQMSLSQMQKHFVFKNIEVLNQLTNQGKSIVIVGGHYGNWEWVFWLANLTNTNTLGTYLKINNPYFEKLMLKSRQRFGGKLIETKQFRKTIQTYYNQGEAFILGLLADQSPQKHRAKYWPKFFGHTVPVHIGPEKLSKQYDLAYIFMKIKKVKRGYYEVTFELLTDTPKNYKDFEITDIFIDKLEKQITEAPEYYLWTHRRFKHKREKEKGEREKVKGKR